MKPVDLLHYDPGLMEETVFLAIREDREAKRFHRERHLLYEITNAEERERAFQDFYRTWFFRLGFSEQIEKALGEQSLISSGVKGCFFSPSPPKPKKQTKL